MKQPELINAFIFELDHAQQGSWGAFALVMFYLHLLPLCHHI